MCDLVTKAQVEAIAGKPNTEYRKSSNTQGCQFRHDHQVQGEQFIYYGLNGRAYIISPSAAIRTSAMKDFRDTYADGQAYPCDVGDDCAVIHKGSGTEARMNVGEYHVRLNAIVVRTPGASSAQNIRSAQERAVKLLQLIANALANS